jgi:hypothetical protein
MHNVTECICSLEKHEITIISTLASKSCLTSSKHSVIPHFSFTKKDVRPFSSQSATIRRPHKVYTIDCAIYSFWEVDDTCPTTGVGIVRTSNTEM